MLKEEFITSVAEKIKNYITDELKEGLIIEPIIVTKANDQKLTGLKFVINQNGPCPTFYLEDAFRDYEDGTSIDDIARSIASSVEDSFDNIPFEYEEGEELDFNQMTLGLRLLDSTRNTEYLKDVPNKNALGDLVLVCDLRMKTPDGGMCAILVNRKIAQIMGYSDEELFKKALDAAWDDDMAIIESMQEKLTKDSPRNLLLEPMPIDIIHGPDAKPELFILTTESGIHGAAALFYPGIMDMIYCLILEDFYVLPSSTEEVIIVPESMGTPQEELLRMVCEVNEKVVDPKEILCNKVFKYTNAEKSFSHIL